MEAPGFAMHASSQRAGFFRAPKMCPRWPALLLLALVIPTAFSFSLGGLRITPYRLVLILAFIPALKHLIAQGRLHAVDKLVLFHVLWCFVAIGYHHGVAAAFESGGIRAVEIAGAYFVGRAYIRNERHFRGAVALLLVLIAMLLPLIVLESVSNVHHLRELAARITGTGFESAIEGRFGLRRAYGPFDHPILLGVFCAGVLGMTVLNAVPRLGRPQQRAMPKIVPVMAAMTSLSAGPMAALMAQFSLLGWERCTRGVSRRWIKLSAILLFVYAAIDLMSNRSGMKVLLHYLTFSAHTAHTRLIIFDYGLAEILRHPWLGIGFNDWTRPGWLGVSVDNFWLVQGMSFGIPAFATIAGAFVLGVSKGWRDMPPRLARLRTGWTISIIGIAVAACTVHLWNNVLVYYCFLLGAGHWFLDARRMGEPPEEPYLEHSY